MTNFSHGREAEAAATEYLKRQRYEIIARNWRTRWCEIDIVAKKDKVMYLVEVKYRKTNEQGTGLDYVTPKKLNQMRFAAEFWVQDSGWKGDYSLAAVEVSGQKYIVTQFIENV